MIKNGKPVRLLLRGTPGEIARWLPFGRNRFETARDSGLPSQVENPNTATGLRVRHWPGGGALAIEAGGCPALDCGFVDHVWQFSEPVWTIRDPAGVIHREVRNFYPKTVKSAGGELKSTYGPWAGSRKLAKTNTWMSFTPTMYTGEMRKVVQVLLGQGADMPYLPLFLISHGICTINNTKWVIEVSADRGVVAWKLRVCKSAKVSKNPVTKEIYDTLGCYPIKSELVSANPNAEVIKLLDYTALTEVFGKSPLFPECGWAFNSSGSSCLNTVFDVDGAGYLHGYLYRIDIVDDGKRPISARLEFMEQDYVYGNRISQVKYPLYFDQNIVTFDWYRGKVSPPPVAVWNGPVYAYYEGDSEVVVRCTKPGTSTTLPPNSNFPPGYLPRPDFIGTWRHYYGVTNSILPCPTINNVGESWQKGFTSGDEDKIEYARQLGVCTFHEYSPTGTAVVGESVDIFLYRSTFGVGVIERDVVVTIPFWERQAVYRYVKEYTSHTTGGSLLTRRDSWQKQEQILGWPQGQYKTINGVSVYQGTAFFGGAYQGPGNGQWDTKSGGFYPEPWGVGLIGLVAQTAHFVNEPGWPHYEPYYDENAYPHAEKFDFQTITGIPAGTTITDISSLYVRTADSGEILVNDNPQYNFLTFNDGSNHHFIECVADTFGSGFFASKDMDVAQGSDLFASGLANYPISELTNSQKLRFFIGKP